MPPLNLHMTPLTLHIPLLTVITWWWALKKRKMFNIYIQDYRMLRIFTNDQLKKIPSSAMAFIFVTSVFLGLAHFEGVSKSNFLEYKDERTEKSKACQCSMSLPHVTAACHCRMPLPHLHATCGFIDSIQYLFAIFSLYKQIKIFRFICWFSPVSNKCFSYLSATYQNIQTLQTQS